MRIQNIFNLGLGMVAPTVRMVGVTKAQQTLQNMFGWNPIIISMSSQNLVRPRTQQPVSLSPFTHSTKVDNVTQLQLVKHILKTFTGRLIPFKVFVEYGIFRIQSEKNCTNTGPVAVKTIHDSP